MNHKFGLHAQEDPLLRRKQELSVLGVFADFANQSDDVEVAIQTVDGFFLASRVSH